MIKTLSTVAMQAGTHIPGTLGCVFKATLEARPIDIDRARALVSRAPSKGDSLLHMLRLGVTDLQQFLALTELKKLDFTEGTRFLVIGSKASSFSEKIAASFDRYVGLPPLTLAISEDQGITHDSILDSDRYNAAFIFGYMDNLDVEARLNILSKAHESLFPGGTLMVLGNPKLHESTFSPSINNRFGNRSLSRLAETAGFTTHRTGVVGGTGLGIFKRGGLIARGH